MTRPKLNIEREFSDRIFDGLTLIFLILIIAWPLYYYSDLSESIPTHYNSWGEPDKLSQKGKIWTLPILGVVMSVGLFILNRFPHLFNYPVQITKENAAQQYLKATQFIRKLNTIITASLFYIVYSTIQTALNEQNGLGVLFLPLFLLLIFISIGNYLYQALKKENRNV
ncbi:DUF1648 domain-containing protein [bacterium]|nr:DUF1648 domain-containing protein [bacterium]